MKPIRYYSTNLKAPEVSFSEALLKGLAPDGGLYLPDVIPQVTNEELRSFSDRPYFDIAFTILSKFSGEEIGKKELMEICKEAYNFDIPLEKVTDRKYIMRLDRGPTASFKDFAARIMSRLMQYFLSVNNQKLTILTATSGDTGSAVASAFYDLKNIDVIILFPRNEVSEMQRKQMTTLGKNIKVIAVDGKFDDCQHMVKSAFNDTSLSHLPLSSANSINIGRLLPQSVYYFYAWSRLAENTGEKVTYSVPSGNFGNLMGGMLAARMGLPVSRFIISTNENDEVPELLRTGIYRTINPSKNCISNAMNVGHPSNLARIIDLYGGRMDENGVIVKQPDLVKMRKDLFGVAVSDDITRSVIEGIYKKFNILIEPHGAVAWHGLVDYANSIEEKKSQKQLFISLETAHPAKFPDELKSILNVDPPLPESLSVLSGKKEKYYSIENNYLKLKEFILKNS